METGPERKPPRTVVRMSESEPEERAAREQAEGPPAPPEKHEEDGYLLRLKYLQADFENYRKRAEKELGEREEASLRGLVSTLLSSLDELGLAVENARKGAGGGELADGLEMVERRLASSLEAAGLERIDCVGMPFDPAKHEAVERVQGESPGEDLVKEEVRPGYAFRGRVIRPSMVKVELALKTPAKQEAVSDE